MDTPVSKTETGDQRASIIVLVLTICVLALLLWIDLRTIPRFRQLFEHMLEGRALPTLTALIMALPGRIFALAIVLAGGCLVAKELAMTDRRRTLTINGCALIAALAAVGVAGLALSLPLFTLITELRR